MGAYPTGKALDVFLPPRVVLWLHICAWGKFFQLEALFLTSLRFFSATLRSARAGPPAAVKVLRHKDFGRRSAVLEFCTPPQANSRRCERNQTTVPSSASENVENPLSRDRVSEATVQCCCLPAMTSTCHALPVGLVPELRHVTTMRLTMIDHFSTFSAATAAEAVSRQSEESLALSLPSSVIAPRAR